MKSPEIRKSWEYFRNKYSQYFQSNEEIWYTNLNKLEKYILENNKLPPRFDKNKEIKQLGMWVSNQKSNYKKEIEIMKSPDIRKSWEDFRNKYIINK